MKFLIDAQLPPSLKSVFSAKGLECIHTLDLELKNNTSDRLINKISVEQERILITKDTDFLNSFIVRGEPYKLLLVKFGNTSKTELKKIFADTLEEIIEKFKTEDIVIFKK